MRKRILLIAFTILAWVAAPHSDLAQTFPTSNQTPTPTVPPMITPPPVPSPTPLPTHTPIPTASPPRVPSPTPIATPTVPEVNPPSPTPVTTPSIAPPTGLRGKANPQSARATIYYGQNAVLALKNDQGRFQKVAVQPNQVVTVVLTLSPRDYGKPADVQILDGGAMTTAVSLPLIQDMLPSTPSPESTPPINGPSGPDSSATPPLPVISPPPAATPDASTLVDSGQLMTVSSAGHLVFGFKPGNDIGLHRIAVMVGGNQYVLNFWRENPSAPASNVRMPRAY